MGREPRVAWLGGSWGCSQALAGVKVTWKRREEGLAVECIFKEPHSSDWQGGAGCLQEASGPLHVSLSKWSGLPRNLATGCGVKEWRRERRREWGKETEIGSQVETLTFLLPSLGRHIESFLSCSIGADNPKPLSIFKEREHKTLLLVGHNVRSTSRKR